MKISDSKQLRRVKREAKIKRKREARQQNLKQHWVIWRDNFDDEVTAMVEGLSACELLSRNIACLISQQTDYYHYFQLDNDQDVSRMCHFNELKNLWLKRNQNNIVKTLQPINCNSGSLLLNNHSDKDETFISYLDSVQIFQHLVIVGDKEYDFISDKAWGGITESDEVIVCAKSLSDSLKQKILNQNGLIFTFNTLVLAIEYGCQAFWRENWVKK